MKYKIKKIINFFLNPHLIVCLGIGWFITNGWAYLAILIGIILNQSWIYSIAAAYLTILWIPFTPEKIITVIIAIWLLSKLFPDDVKSLSVLRSLKKKYIKVKRKNYFYCSEFIRYLFEECKLKLELPEIIKPNDFKDLDKLKMLYCGMLRDYKVYNNS